MAVDQSVLSRVILFLTLLIYSSPSIDTQPLEYPTANLSTSWINKPSPVRSSLAQVTPILLRGIDGTRFVCGFYCNSDSTACLFAVLIFQNRPDSGISSIVESPQPVWSANRDNPVKVNATLQLTQDGDLILADADGTLVWSTNTSGKSVSGLNLTDMGNLVLFDRNNEIAWQSFDYPTDSLVPGQGLYPMQGLFSLRTLTASISKSNWTKGLLSLVTNGSDLLAYVDANPPQFYYSDWNDDTTPVQPLSAARFMKLEPDGHLRDYEWGGSDWKVVADLLTGYTGECGYPMVCGKYGICSNGQCGCPDATRDERSYFKPTDSGQPNLGCSAVTPISCELSDDHSFLELRDVEYFFFRRDIENIDIENCKLACLRNCSCKAAIFRYASDSSSGNCFLPSEIFSLMNNNGHKYNVTISIPGEDVNRTILYTSSQEKNIATITFLKVQNSTSVSKNGNGNGNQKRHFALAVPLGSSLGAFFGVLLLIGVAIVILKRKSDSKEFEEDYLDEVPGMTTRFSFEDLKAMTENFSKKLGEGGFGSVFEGTLSNGTKVAVKQLDGVVQVKKSFLAEVETIGNIHHVNLVRLAGFCAEKSHRLLVYEYMCNGSLDKWIFHKNGELSLGWPLRRKIISNIAKGLAYLHEECRQKILHLDIKPQNILLDENFNAKVSDFGLSKLIDKEQSRVVTTLRGTPGYLAPEWLSSVITEKVDVYSFGVVVLEILCGRKNFDRSQPEEDMHLLSLLKRKAEEEQLLDMVDKNCEGMKLHGAEVMEMLMIAAWCLQSDFTKRPSMSVVVKVLEGLMDVESNLEFCFTYPPVPRRTKVADINEGAFSSATALLPSVLSGPR